MITIDSLKEMSTKKLVDLFEMTASMTDKFVPVVRGWIMDEIESRNPDGFNEWLDGDCEDSDLAAFVL